MINFTGRLPAEWEPQWTAIKKSSYRWNDRGLEDEEIQPSLDETSVPEYMYADQVDDPKLEPVLHVIQGLMQLWPSSRMCAGETLRLLENQEEN